MSEISPPALVLTGARYLRYHPGNQWRAYAPGSLARGAFACPRGVARVVMPPPAPDGKVYLTTAQAAEEFGVTPDCVLRWRRLGYLEPAVTSARGRSLWELVALAGAEKMARDAAIATSGSGKRVRRNMVA